MPRIPIIGPSAGPSFLPRPARPESSAPDVSGLVRGAEQFQAGLDRQRAEIEHEEKLQTAQRKAAEKAEAQAQQLSVDDLLVDTYEEHARAIEDGTADKTSARSKWAEKSRVLIDMAAEKVPPEHRSRVQQALTLKSSRLERHIARAVTRRDRADTKSAIGQTLEYASRMSETDYSGARILAMQTLNELGSWAGMDAAEIQRTGQKWLEESAYTRALGGLSRAKTNNQALSRVEQTISGMADLDPRRKVELLDRAQGYRIANEQRAEIQANRAERLRERAERKARDAAEAFAALADKGGALAPAYVDTVVKATAGTPWAPVVRSVVEQQKAIGGFASLPLNQQQQALDALDAKIAKEGRTPELDKRREQLQKVLNASKADAKSDPLRGFTERGGDQPPPIDVSTLDALQQTLPARAEHAASVSQWAGREVSPLSESEAAKVADQLAALPPGQRAQRLASLTATMTPQQTQAFASQIEPKDRATALALAAGVDQTPVEKRWFSPDVQPRLVSELILKGAQAKREKTVKDDPAAETGTKARIAKFLGDSLTGKARDSVMEAAHFITLAQQAEGRSPDPKQAVRLAIGGDIIEHNGIRIPVPAGVEDMRAALSTPAAKAVVTQSTDGNFYAGGVPIPVDQFVSQLPEAQLQPAGAGRYHVRAGGSLVTNKAGRPVTVDLR